MDELNELVGGPGLAESIAAALRDAPCMWWVTGGQALRLHLGRVWRHHADLDIGVRSKDLNLLVGHLHRRGLNGVVGDHTRPGSFELTVSDGDDGCWIYRHDRNIRVRWDHAVLVTVAGTPYLSPELQLLVKSRALRDKDDVDGRVVIPELDTARLTWLGRALPAEHPWQTIIEGALR